MGKQMMKLDANELLFFERQLEAIETQTYDVRYPELKARMLIPPSFKTPKGAKTRTYRMYDKVGMAKIVANYAKDFPRVTLKGSEVTSNIRRLGDSFSYTVDDIAAAAMAGIDLEGGLAEAAKRAIMQLENSIAWNGDTDNNIPGFLSNANIPEAAVAADGVGATTTFSTKTPDQIIRDVSALINDIRTVTKGVEAANTVLFPISIMSVLKSTPRSSTSDTTILDFLKRVHPEITLWDDLLELETSGVGATKEMLAYNRSPMFLELDIPEDFTVYEYEKKGLEYEIPCSSKIGGCILRYPLSANLAYGI